MPESLKPPAINRSKSAVARRGDVVDHYRGEAAGDPYRWLECGTDPETAAWVSAQNELTQAWLATVPARAAIRSRLGERWNYARFGVPFERGGRWFQTRNSGLQAQAVLCGLRRYSPLHNVRPAVYPPTLLTTGDHDDRVVPAHWFKFAAALQAAQRGEAPILLRAETSAGHSAAGKPTAKAIAEAADRLAFLDGALGLAPL